MYIWGRGWRSPGRTIRTAASHRLWGGGLGAFDPTDPSLASDAFCTPTVHPGVTVSAQKPVGEHVLPLCVCMGAVRPLLLQIPFPGPLSLLQL